MGVVPSSILCEIFAFSALFAVNRFSGFYRKASLPVFDVQITKCNSSSAKNKGFFRELLRRHRGHGEYTKEN